MKFKHSAATDYPIKLIIFLIILAAASYGIYLIVRRFAG